MKKILLSLLFLASLWASAQTWCPPGAKWHFKLGGAHIGSFTNCDIDLEYTNDTTVLGIPCKKLVATKIGQIWYSSSNPSMPVSSQYFNTYITYQSNGVLFLYNNSNNAFDTVVNFNATIGDQWLSINGSTPGGCLSRSTLTVSDTAHVIINGFSLKKITTIHNYTVNSTVLTYTNVFLERILFTGGGLDSHVNLFPVFCQPAGQATDIPVTLFRCYEDDVFPVYNATNGNCKDFWTGIKTYENNVVGIRAYPNPASDQLTVDLPYTGAFELRLSDLAGRQINTPVSHQENKLQADLRSLSPGVYFFQLHENGKAVGIEKVIKQ